MKKFSFSLIIAILFYIREAISAEGGLRITYDPTKSKVMPDFDGDTDYAKSQYDHVDDLLQVCAKFFEDLIKVDQHDEINIGNYSGEIMKTFETSCCGPSTINNSDLHIFVSYEKNESQTYVAYASALQYEALSNQPEVGLVNINFAHLTYDSQSPNAYQQFEYNLETVLHELFHVLGFNRGALDDFKTGYKLGQQPNAQFTKVGDIYWLKSEKVLEAAKAYFDDNSIESVPMENQGGSGSAGSHWERMMIQNDFMTASVISSDAAISTFSLAFLQDTNWYKEIKTDMAEDCMQWGKGKGKTFIEAFSNPDKNCGNGTYQEFYPEKKSDQCDFYHFGYGYSAKPSFSNECYVTQIYSNADCTKPYSGDDNGDSSYETKGIHSKCFMSTIAFGQKPYRCYEYECDADSNVFINFNQGGEKKAQLQCTDNGQTLDAPAGMSGQLTCPADLKAFCKFPVPCLNYCSGKGYCLRKDRDGDNMLESKCHCVDGFSGIDCSQECTAGIYSIQYKPDEDCVDSCGTGYIQDEALNMCILGECDSSCYDNSQICDGPTQSDCQDCGKNEYYYDKKCVKDCPNGYISLDGKKCEQCPGTGDKCLNYDKVNFQNKIAKITLQGQDGYICPDLFGINDALVFCKSKLSKGVKEYKFVDCDSPNYMARNFACNGSEQTIDKCQYDQTSLCSSNKCVQIECTDDQPEDYYTFLLDNQMVVMYYGKGYGNICADHIQGNSANVVCKQTGKTQAKTIGNEGTCTEPVLINKLECSGSEDSIEDCKMDSKFPESFCDGSCLTLVCEGDAINDVENLVKDLAAKIDGIYLILAYVFGAALVMIVAIYCVAQKCMPNPNKDYRYVLKKSKHANKTDLDGDGDYYDE